MPSVSSRSSSRVRRRRRRLLPLVGVLLLALVLVLDGPGSSRHRFAVPSRSSLAGLSLRQRIVAIARSQIGYRTRPTRSYCNRFSAYWHVGATDCPRGEAAEEWCADFAAWVWRRAGVPVLYGFGPGELNAGAGSFYGWGVAHGAWHPAGDGYRPRPGDVAVYGLSLGATASALHVAVVTAQPAGQRGPDVVNGDGDRTGFSVVEFGANEVRADTGRGGGAPLTGYVSPT